MQAPAAALAFVRRAFEIRSLLWVLELAYGWVKTNARRRDAIKHNWLPLHSEYDIVNAMQHREEAGRFIFQGRKLHMFKEYMGLLLQQSLSHESFDSMY